MCKQNTYLMIIHNNINTSFSAPGRGGERVERRRPTFATSCSRSPLQGGSLPIGPRRGLPFQLSVPGQKVAYDLRRTQSICTLPHE